MTLQQLVIRNLSVLEQAPIIAQEVEDSIMQAVGNRVKDCIERRPDWWADMDYKNGTICDFGPNDWPHDVEKDIYKAHYRLEGTSIDPDAYNYYISALTGAVSFEFGIVFAVDAPWMTHLAGPGARPKAAWQRFLATQAAERHMLQSKGFRLIGERLFLPIRIAADDLANAYPDALDDALTPVDDAMAVLQEAHPEIDAIIQAAAVQFPSSAPTSPQAALPVIPEPSSTRKSAKRLVPA